ncbi:hypothetical protein AMTRI_Chr02g220830 [Amborella trichopoda]
MGSLSGFFYELGFMGALLVHGICYADTVPGSFVFGDSLVDAGNNNYIVSLSKANYLPNGIDFAPLRQPTGRFTNGRTIPDILGQELGLTSFAPPYLAPTTKGLATLQGVNYASGAGGILNGTGQLFGGRINLDAQIDNYANTRQDTISILGKAAASKLFQRGLFSMTMGSNDFINNYLAPVVSEAECKVSPDAFVEDMISKYRLQLTRLYNLDARKIVVVNVGPIGCIPYQRDINPTAGNDCVAFPNQLAMAFNGRLRGLLSELSSNLKGSKFVYADVYSIVSDIIENYTNYGFEVPDSACCCAGGRFGGLIPCGPVSKFCLDRSKYIFWDPYHPSEATNVIIAKRLLDGDWKDVFPVNIRKLVQA